MVVRILLSTLFCMQFLTAVTAAEIDPDVPYISYVQFQAQNLEDPESPLTISAQLRIPPVVDSADGPEPGMAAVVILHGSSGVDSRGGYYAKALNKAGIATLEIDMWGARNLAGGADRPALPTLTVPDAFAAPDYLANYPGIDPGRIGVLGFSWGGVVSLLAANEDYVEEYNGDNQFAAHVAHYPVCWAYNIGIPGVVFNDLTGAPVLIQVGDKDDYDEGGEPCQNLADSVPDYPVSVQVYANAHHAWDRLQPAVQVIDPFSHLGLGGTVDIVPNPGKAQQSRTRVLEFFSDTLGL